MRPGVVCTRTIGVSKRINNISRTSWVACYHRSRCRKRSTTIIRYGRRRRRCSCSGTSHCRSCCSRHSYNWRSYTSGMCPGMCSTRAISISESIDNIARTSGIASYYGRRNSKRSTAIIRYSRRCWCNSCRWASYCRSSCSRHCYYWRSYCGCVCPCISCACTISIGERVNNIARTSRIASYYRSRYCKRSAAIISNSRRSGNSRRSWTSCS